MGADLRLFFHFPWIWVGSDCDSPGISGGWGLSAPIDGFRGKSIVLFTNGDKYVGGLRNGQKDGEGMCAQRNIYTGANTELQKAPRC